MTFTAPLGLLALLAVPAVIALHRFRRVLRERRVAGLFLWTGDRLVADAGRTRTRLLRTPSLWLECLAAVVLALWLAGLSFGGAPARHLVVVLDDSASMAAGGRARATAELQQRLDALGAGDRATLLRTGARPELLAGPVAPALARAALDGWRPVQRRHDAAPALDLARELAGGSGEIVFLTDTAPLAPPVDVTVLAFGAPRPNTALLTAQRHPHGDGGERLRLRCAAFGAVAATTVTVTIDAQPSAPVAVAFADGIADLELALPQDAGTVHVALAPDALPVDDVAWLLRPPPREVAVCDLLPADERRAFALDRVFAAIGGVRKVADPRTAQLLLATRPGALRPGQTEVVFDAGADDVVRQGWRAPFAIDRTHPWLAGVALHGVTWLAGERTLPGRVLVAAGAQALVAEEVPEAGERLWLNLDGSAGNVVRAPDWPVLWANVVERARREVPGPERSDVLLGEEARCRRSLLAAGDDREFEVRDPDGQPVPTFGDRVVGFVPERPGVHRVLGAGGRELARIAARFVDPAESDLRDLGSGAWPAQPSAAAGEGARDGGAERRWLALLLVALVLGDWWWLARRGA